MQVHSSNISWIALLCVLGSCRNTPSDTVPSSADTIQVEEVSYQAGDSIRYGGDTMPIERTVEYIMGRFEPSTRSDFAVIDTDYADREGLYLRRDAYDAFIAMYQHALQDSIRLIIRSATRNFDYQKGIWERKWTGETTLEAGVKATAFSDPKVRALEILKYSSMPGTSRHHWGTDIDLNAFSNSYFEQGPGLKLFNWLNEHANTYGFCRPYTAKNEGRPSGYEEEKWHWSYWPVSSQLLLEAQEILTDTLINGFLGSDQASEINVVENYVHGINHDCKL